MRLGQVVPLPSLVQEGQVVLGRQRVGVVGSKLGRPGQHHLLEERLGLRVARLLLVDPGQAVLADERVGVVGPELQRPGSHDLLVERLRLVVPPLVPVERREVVSGTQGLGMVAPERRGIGLDHLQVERLGLVVLLLGPILLRQVVLARQGVRMVGAQPGRLASHHVQREALGPVVLRLSTVQVREAALASQGVGVVGTEVGVEQLHRPFELPLRLRIVAQRPIGLAHRQSDRRLRQRLLSELALDRPRGAVQERSYSHIGVAPPALGRLVREVRLAEQVVLQELADRGGVPLGPQRAHRLPGADRGPRHQQHHAGRGRERADTVPAQELRDAVARGGRAGLDRLVVEIALDVSRQRARRLVASRAVLLERFHHDPVELAPHFPGEP